MFSQTENGDTFIGYAGDKAVVHSGNKDRLRVVDASQLGPYNSSMATSVGDELEERYTRYHKKRENQPFMAANGQFGDQDWRDIAAIVLHRKLHGQTIWNLRLITVYEYLCFGDDCQYAPVMIVGGAVRDVMRDMKLSSINDIDLAVGLTPTELDCRLRHLKGRVGNAACKLRRNDADKHFGMHKMIRLEHAGREERDDLDVAVFKSFRVPVKLFDAPNPLETRSELVQLFGFSFETDAASRDFTINAVFVDALSGRIEQPASNGGDSDVKFEQGAVFYNTETSSTRLPMVHTKLVSATTHIHTLSSWPSLPEGLRRICLESLDAATKVDYGSWFRFFKELSKSGPGEEGGRKVDLGVYCDKQDMNRVVMLLTDRAKLLSNANPTTLKDDDWLFLHKMSLKMFKEDKDAALWYLKKYETSFSQLKPFFPAYREIRIELRQFKCGMPKISKSDGCVSRTRWARHR